MFSLILLLVVLRSMRCITNAAARVETFMNY